MADKVTLCLGDVTFDGLEIPDKITVGGTQHVVVHELVGGVRVVDAMGRQDAALSWSGRFRGPKAVDRVNQIDAMRIAGKSVSLTWDSFSYEVIIDQFSADYEMTFEIPYKINCTIIKQNTKPADSSAKQDNKKSDSDPNKAIAEDIVVSAEMVVELDDAIMTPLMNKLLAAVGTLEDFTAARQKDIQGILNALAPVQTRLSDLIAETEDVALAVVTYGGLVPNTPAAHAVTKMAMQLNTYVELPFLKRLESRLGRLHRNLDKASHPGKEITVAGKNLMVMATEQYGDFRQWTLIARANALIDPQVNGVKVLKVPPKAMKSGGVLE